MRVARTFAALLCIDIVRTTIGALTAVTNMTASTNGWDERTSGYGCVPSSCHAGLAIDGFIDEQSRWSCKSSVSLVDACKLTLTLDEPQDLVEMRIFLWKGKQRIRSMNIFADGALVTTIKSSGKTKGFEAYELTAIQASSVVVQAVEPLPDNGWLSIIEIKLMVESDVIVEEIPAVTPSDDTYIGCFADTPKNRIMSIVTTMDDLTPEACLTYCTKMGSRFRFYALQQGNECWCSGCDLTDNDRNTAYDRHGAGICTAACTGNSSMACGGNMAFSLYRLGSCGCPDYSVPSSLEISLVWTQNTDLDLHVIEPGGQEVYYSQRLGEVGTMSDDNVDGPGSETYTLLNGLNIDEDDVLGTYRAYITNGGEGTSWTLTARLAGELEWAVSSFIPSHTGLNDDEPTFYSVTVVEYSEGTCAIDLYGTCPEGSIGDEGTPPCVVCPNGRTSREGSSTCFSAALQYVHASDELLELMERDATGGFAGPGNAEIDGADHIWQRITLNDEDHGVLEVTGTFEREVNGDASLPSSTALFVYLEPYDGPFICGVGTINSSTGGFTATVTGVPDGFSKIFYSFVVLDLEDAVEIDTDSAESVFDADVISFRCPSPLTITLEWNTDTSDFDMEITEPDGSVWFAWDIGTYGFGSGDAANGFGPEIWTVFPGNSEAVGTYTVRLYFLTAPADTEWTLTARVKGEVAWIETGIYEPSAPGFSYSYYMESSWQSDLFSVTLGSVDTENCQ